ncbi:hypothetical protein EVAR_57319_1 [Eumeta japonica]|uniref:Uncharacterized protein n=1 Tax=Eumeta variegata TaxID=151549 RepID=A0A4C2A1N4_EUMVA|nr:hypothetical protein EVAR_57319_1 [Eumeta japonica]
MLDATAQCSIETCRAYKSPSIPPDPREVAPLDIRVGKQPDLLKRGSESWTSVLNGSSKPVDFREMPHPAPELGFESVEPGSINSRPSRHCRAAHIYHGSKTEGKVGAAVKWRDEMESKQIFRLENILHGIPVEMFELYIVKIVNNKARIGWSTCDSKSSQMTGNKSLAHAARQDIRDIVAETGKCAYSFAGTLEPRTKRADEISRGKHPENASDYDRYPLSYA